MTPLGLYEPGSSLIHRIPAGWKFVAMVGFAAVIFFLRAPEWLGGIAGMAVVGYLVARVPLRRCWQIARTVVPLIAVLFTVQWWLLDLPSATVVCLRLAGALLIANLFTLATRVDDLVSVVERALRPAQRFGVQPESAGLLVGLTLQAVSVLSMLASETRDAQRARNAERSISAFAVPLLVRTLRHADELGEALAARGVGD